MKKHLLYFSLLLLLTFSCKAYFFPGDLSKTFAAIDAIMNDNSYRSLDFLQRRQASLEQELADVKKSIEQSSKTESGKRQIAQFKTPETCVIKDEAGVKKYRISMEFPYRIKEENIKVKINKKNKEAAQLVIIATAQEAGDAQKTEGEKKASIQMSQSIVQSSYSTASGSQEMTVKNNNGTIEIQVTLDLPDNVQSTRIPTKKVMTLEKADQKDHVTLHIDLPVNDDESDAQGTELQFTQREVQK